MSERLDTINFVYILYVLDILNFVNIGVLLAFASFDNESPCVSQEESL